MPQNTPYDFDRIIDRTGTYAEKYDARKRIFGNDTAEPFWVADMDLPTPAFLVDALHARVAHPIFGYTDADAGTSAAIQRWLDSQHGLRTEKSWVRLSPSVVTSMSHAIQVLSQPNDSVVFLSPVYGPFFTTVRQNGRHPLDVPLRPQQNRYEIDFDALESALARPDATLLLLCNPHNPGGRVFSRAELSAMVDLCHKHNVHIFSDEIHCDIVFAPHAHTSILSIEAAHPISIVAFSIGKLFNTSGLNASFALIPNPKLRAQFVSATQRSHCADINLLGKVALTTAMSPQGAEYKRQLIAYLAENTQEVHRILSAIPGVSVMRPEATYLVWGDFRALGTPTQVAKRLIDDAQVLLSGGAFFGQNGDGWFRANCAHPRQRLYPAMERVLQALTPGTRPHSAP